MGSPAGPPSTDTYIANVGSSPKRADQSVANPIGKRTRGGRPTQSYGRSVESVRL